MNNPTDAELIAAIDRGIAAGTIVVVDDAFLADLAADLGADDVDTCDDCGQSMIRGRRCPTSYCASNGADVDDQAADDAELVLAPAPAPARTPVAARLVTGTPENIAARHAAAARGTRQIGLDLGVDVADMLAPVEGALF